MLQFPVHGDTQRLESARCRMPSAPPIADAAHCARHHFGQPPRSMNRTVGNDAARYCPAAPFLAVAVNQVGQLLRIGRVHQVRGGRAGRVIPHIQRLVRLKRETVAGPVNLPRRKPQIQQDAVNGGNAMPGGDLRHVRIAAMRGNQPAAILMQPLPGNVQRARIPVNPQRYPVGTREFQQPLRVAALAKSAVKVHAAAADGQPLHRFRQQNRAMQRQSRGAVAGRVGIGVPVRIHQ